MYHGKRVIVVTPAGRRRYLEILAHYVRPGMDGIVDEWHLWANTEDQRDRTFIEAMGDRAGVRVIEAGNPRDGICNIRNFYPHACDPDTLYVRLDDDLVYLAPTFFQELLGTRMSDSESFLVSAAVVNNVLCDWLRQRSGILASRQRLAYRCMCPIGWSSGLWAQHVHRAFLQTAKENPMGWLSKNDLTGWFAITDWLLLDHERLSINAVCWRGEDMAEIVADGGVGGDEESWLTEVYPKQAGRYNRICGSAIAAHFAFAPQRPYLETTDILDRYRELTK